MKDIAVFGAGGFGREIFCLIKLINGDTPKWNFIGFLDDNEALHGASNEYGAILGGVDWLNARKEPLSVVIAVGEPNAVSHIAARIVNPLVAFPNLIAPSVVFLDRDSLKIGKGNILCSNCLFSCHVEMGDFNIFNGYIPVGHDVRIGNSNVVMPSCNISGGVVIGDENFFGVQSVVLQNVKIGNHTRIGTGSVVMRKTKDGYLYLGNPAKRVEL